MPEPLFITFEGIDGSGKSTQIKAFSAYLSSIGIAHIATREPGGSEGGELIRTLLVQGEINKWSAQTEILLFTAARCDHMEKKIQPALSQGKTVLCDRFIDSTRVYQSAKNKVFCETIDTLHETFISREPDLTFIIDINPEIALKRGLARHSNETRFENMGLEFQKKLRQRFLELSQKYTERCHVIDGHQNPDKIESDIKDIYKSILS